MAMEEYWEVARWWETQENKKVKCYLCPRECVIPENSYGFCKVRKNIEGTLYTSVYKLASAIHLDPIEKKPLYHFYPSTYSLSVGTLGCNLKCIYCQNWEISQYSVEDYEGYLFSITPKDIVYTALKYKSPSISYTYNEPTIFGELVVDTSKIAREYGLKNVMVTNGFISEKSIYEVYKYIDAANVDLKAMDEEFYKKYTLSDLKPVLNALKILRKELGVWVEITNLIIPRANDTKEQIERLVDWVLENLGDDVPIHFSAFHPDYKLTDRSKTPPEVVKNARKLAIEKGVKYAYTGNIWDIEGGSTYCPNCKNLLIKREWFEVSTYNVDKEGRCKYCGQKIDGFFGEININWEEAMEDLRRR